MKFFLSLIFVLMATVNVIAQRGQVGIYIPIDNPIKSSMPNMTTASGIGFSTAYSPFYSAFAYLEFKANIGTYSNKTLSQTYQFDDGTQTVTDVSYGSNLNKYILGTKIMLNGDYKAIRAYITPQIGLANYRTRIVIADPEDIDQCAPLDRKITQKFTGVVAGGEIGAEVSLERIFSQIQSENKHKAFFALSYLHGLNHFEYVNIKYMQDEVHTTNVTHESADLNASFINVSTNNIHEHKVAELYHTPFEIISLNIGYIINF